jgi:hypothetical protein
MACMNSLVARCCWPCCSWQLTHSQGLACEATRQHEAALIRQRKAAAQLSTSAGLRQAALPPVRACNIVGSIICHPKPTPCARNNFNMLQGMLLCSPASPHPCCALQCGWHSHSLSCTTTGPAVFLGLQLTTTGHYRWSSCVTHLHNLVMVVGSTTTCACQQYSRVHHMSPQTNTVRRNNFNMLQGKLHCSPAFLHPCLAPEGGAAGPEM